MKEKFYCNEVIAVAESTKKFLCKKTYLTILEQIGKCVIQVDLETCPPVDSISLKINFFKKKQV